MSKIEEFDLDDILIDEKSYENIIAAKPLRIRFYKKDGLIRVSDETGYLVLFESEKYDLLYNRIRYLIGVKSGITYVISHNYAKIEVYSYDSLS